MKLKHTWKLIAVFAVLALTFQTVVPAEALTRVVDLGLGKQNVVIRGGHDQGTFGEVSVLGDFNNDGIDDLLVGAAATSIGDRKFAGAAYVLLGKQENRSLHNLADRPADLTIYGANAGDVLGHSVAVGDVNGDNIQDILIGADLVDHNGEDVGAVYIFLGRPNGEFFNGGVKQPSEADVIIYGQFDGGRFGRSLAAGDVTGNNIDDILVGAYYASPGGRTEAGALYVIQGSHNFTISSQTVINLKTNPGQASLRIYGQSGDLDQAPPSSISSAGDPVHPALLDGIDSTEQILALGDRLGRTVAVGNVNGQGPLDIIVSAYTADVNDKTEAGQTYIFYGSSSFQNGSTVIDLGNGDTADVTLYGVDSGDHSGFYVGSGNINGDAYDDVMISAYLSDGYENSGAQTGEVYIILGRADLPSTINLATQADITIYGEAAGDRLGRSLALSDIRGNGTDDILIGASRATPYNRTAAGKAYVIYTDQQLSQVIQLNQTQLSHMRILGAATGEFSGENACVSDVDAGILEGNCPDELGRAIAAGDFNGDGHNDIVVGALFSNNEDKYNAGAVYVIYSNYGTAFLPVVIQ
jgi:hypothetical protein